MKPKLCKIELWESQTLEYASLWLSIIATSTIFVLALLGMARSVGWI